MLPTPTVEDFADATREFIAWVEGDPGEPMDEARTAQQHLARLPKSLSRRSISQPHETPVAGGG